VAGERPALTHLPGGTYALAFALGTRRLLAREWAGSPMHRWTLVSPRPEGLGTSPRDPRPVDAMAGRKILAGRFELGGAVLDTGSRGDPWDRPSPSRRFALALHRLDWLRDLLAVGPDANAEGLRLVLDWSRVFGRWNSFSWNPTVLGRRVFNLACAVQTVSAGASDAERALIALDLARQARHLLATLDGPEAAAERACAVALAGTAVTGKAGGRLIDRGLHHLLHALPVTVAPDGGHTSRNPRAALDLLLDLQTLDEALVQRGVAPPEEMLRAIDRLSGAVRFFILADGGLPDMQGAEAGRRAYVAAAGAGEADAAPPPPSRNGYQRLESGPLQVIADAAPPAEGPWSQTACAQPLAIEVLAQGRRLIVSCGPAPETGELDALRLSDAASTLTVGDATCGAPLRGLRAAALGPRLAGAYETVDARRQEAEGGLLLEMSHDGWGRRFHLRHERRLFMGHGLNELRGEDRLTPMGDAAAAEAGRRFIPFLIRFHLHPAVSGSLALDGRSVLLRGEGDEVGWRLRSDAQEVAVEASIYMADGAPRRTQQVVLRGQCRADSGVKVRWKLERAEAAGTPARIDEAPPQA
jgi:uncharacterized heparinase superfamily protein